jgi:adenosylhomocysteine nucleosidase
MKRRHEIAGLTAPAAVLVFLALLPDLASAAPRTAVVGAFDEEISLILGQVEVAEVQEVLGIRFTVGRLHGRDVVVVESGVGKVNAAMTSALLIDHFRPDEVIFTGIAGALGDSLLPGDIVVGDRTVQHDLVVLQAEQRERFGVRNPRDGARNPVFFAADPHLLETAVEASGQVRLAEVGTSRGTRTPSVVVGIIATGDAFVASRAVKAELHAELGAVAVEMEGAAVAQVCHQHQVPCIVIRSISDEADENADRDLEEFYRTAAANSATLVLQMVQLIAGGR